MSCRPPLRFRSSSRCSSGSTSAGVAINVGRRRAELTGGAVNNVELLLDSDRFADSVHRLLFATLSMPTRCPFLRVSTLTQPWANRGRAGR